MRGMNKDPITGLILPTKFIDEKQSLKRSINLVVEKAINGMGSFSENYFLTIHAMFDKIDSSIFRIGTPSATMKLPSFRSNTLVYWVSPKRGLHELLWMVPAKAKGKKLKVEFNKTGVAYLQAKNAMPKPS